ncbi:hypothetical protein KP509_1Z191800, partial [Ceratopteris richardii]
SVLIGLCGELDSTCSWLDQSVSALSQLRYSAFHRTLVARLQHVNANTIPKEEGRNPSPYCKFSPAQGQGKRPKRAFPFLCLIRFRSLLLTESHSLSLSSPRRSRCTRHARQAWIRFPDWKPMDHRRYLPMAFRLWKRPSFSMPRHPSNAFFSML